MFCFVNNVEFLLVNLVPWLIVRKSQPIPYSTFYSNWPVFTSLRTLQDKQVDPNNTFCLSVLSYLYSVLYNLKCPIYNSTTPLSLNSWVNSYLPYIIVFNSWNKYKCLHYPYNHKLNIYLNCISMFPYLYVFIILLHGAQRRALRR
jgi:hypothetical protein